MTTLKKSLNNPAIQVLRHPDGVILVTPIRLVRIPDEALIAGVSVIGAGLLYAPTKGANTLQVDLGNHEEAQAVLALIGQAMAETPPQWGTSCHGSSMVRPDPVKAAIVQGTSSATSVAASADAKVQAADLSPVDNTPPGTRRAHLMRWLRGEGRWGRRLTFAGLAAFSFWLFYPEEMPSEAPLSFNAPASASVVSPDSVGATSPIQVELNAAPSPYANDPLAIGLNPPEPSPMAGAQDSTSVAAVNASAAVSSGTPGVDQPYVFKPNLVRPTVEAPALNCD